MILSVAALPALGQRWSYTADSSNQEFWVTKHVALGNEGTQVVSPLGSSYPTILLSSFDRGTDASPVWEASSSAGGTTEAVDAASRGDLHAILVREGSSFRLRRFTSQGELASYTLPVSASTYPPTFLEVAAEGQRVVVGAYDDAQNAVRAFVFNGTSSQPFRSWTFANSDPITIDVDDAGRTLLVATSYVRVYDLDTGARIHDQLVGLIQTAAIAGDGGRFAYGRSGLVNVSRRIGSSFVPSSTRSYPGTLARIAFSEDGSTMALASDDIGQNTVTIQAQNVITLQTLLYRSVTGSSPAGYRNFTLDLEVSRNGSRVAAALSGDETGTADEVQVFDTTTGSALVSYDLPGSAFDVDLSSDGKRLAVARRTGHASTFGFGGGGLLLYDLEPRDFDLDGVPRAGSVVTMTIGGGATNETARLLSSTQAANRPVYHVQLDGILYLKRRFTTVAGFGSTNGQGEATLSYLVPNAAGQTVCFQGLTSSLTQDWQKLTILP